MPYLGIVTGLAIGVFLLTSFGGAAVVVPATQSNLSVTIPAPAITASTTSTANENKIAEPKSRDTSAPVTSAILVPQVPITLPKIVDQVALDVSASALRNALVNIICYAPAGGTLHSISGSGVFIDSKGIILTNAHIAQYFLLKDRGVYCAIRSGSPATDRYEAKLIYISPAWLRANPNVLTKTAPNGTGEYDFALLAISKSSTNSPFPSLFPFLPLSTTPPVTGTPVVIASYGAQFLQSDQVASNLSPTIVFGSVKDIFTFATNTIDVLALGGSAAAQEGSSGGGVADASGNLVGTITTSTITGATDTRSLDAITASYIRAEYATETGQALDLLLAKSTDTSITDFSSQIPDLEKIITANL